VFDAEAGALAEPLSPQFRLGRGDERLPGRGRRARRRRGTRSGTSSAVGPGRSDGSSGEHACDHYHRLGEDIGLIANLGAIAYRFSVRGRACSHSARAIGTKRASTSTTGSSTAARAGHRAVPHAVPLGLPQALQESGGWMHRDTRRPLRRLCGGGRAALRRRVASIATHNEPWVVAILGHEVGIFAPGLKSQKARCRSRITCWLVTAWRCRRCERKRCTTPSHRAEPGAHPRCLGCGRKTSPGRASTTG